MARIKYGIFRQFLRHLSPLLQFISLIIPIYFIMFSYYFSSAGRYERDYWSFEKLAQYFIDMKSLVYYSDKHISIGQLMPAVFAVASVLTIWNRIQHLVQSDSELSLWQTLIDGKEQFLLTAIGLTWFFFRVPWHVKSGGA